MRDLLQVRVVAARLEPAHSANLIVSYRATLQSPYMDLTLQPCAAVPRLGGARAVRCASD